MSCLFSFQDYIIHECGPRFPTVLFEKYLAPAGYTIHCFTLEEGDAAACCNAVDDDTENGEKARGWAGLYSGPCDWDYRTG